MSSTGSVSSNRPCLCRKCRKDPDSSQMDSEISTQSINFSSLSLEHYPERPNVEPPVLTGATKRRYLGVLTMKEATNWLKQHTDFRFYHLWNPEQFLRIDDQLPLTVAYRSSQGHIFHWPVRTVGHFEEAVENKMYVTDLYYVEQNGPTFKNLTDFIDCYENMQYLEKGVVDVFRCPKIDSPSKIRRQFLSENVFSRKNK